MRKTAALFTIAIACWGGAALAEGDHHKPLNGGVVSPGREVDYELVAKPDVIQLYLSDHGKKTDHSKASAKVTLLSGKDKQEVTLAPAGDKLEAKGSFKVVDGTKVIAVVTRDGKSLGTARFTVK
jgi:hypothetical protein